MVSSIIFIRDNHLRESQKLSHTKSDDRRDVYEHLDMASTG